MAARKSNKNSKDSKGFIKYIKIFWSIFLLGFVCVILFFLMASWGVFGKMPTFEQLENPDSNVATEIISSDGVTIGKFYLENRTPVKYADLPQHLVDALVSTRMSVFMSTRASMHAEQCALHLPLEEVVVQVL